MKPKIKVLFFMNSFQIGGCHLQMTYLIEMLKTENFEPIICTHISDEGGLRSAYYGLSVKIYNLSRRHKLDFSILKKLKEIITNEKIEIIVLSIPQNFIYYKLVEKSLRRKIYQVGLLRAMGFWLGHRNRLFKIVDDYLAAKFIKSSDVVIANSNAIKHRYERDFSLDRNKIKVFYNYSEFKFPITKSKEEVRAELNIRSNDILIIMVARLDPWKDFDTLLDAAKQVKQKFNDFKFIICGGGQLEENIKTAIGKNNLHDTVFLLGEQSNVSNFINAADISVLTTKGEGFSNAILESMALSKPVIATNVGGNSELIGIDSGCGFLVKEKDSHDLANLLLKLRDNRDLINETGERARQRIMKLCGRENLSSMVDEFKKLKTENALGFSVSPV